jgi:transglutaminase-like putative cysteine protease
MIFDIHYTTTYDYAAAVTDNTNAVRVRPAANGSQQTTRFELQVTPSARLFEHRDYFGTWVHEFDVVQPHERLSIAVATRVATTVLAPPPDPGWSALDGAYAELAAEFLMAHEAAQPHPTLTELEHAARCDTPLATALRLSELIPDTFEYRRGVTYVGSTVADLLEAGAGVCQDFVHIALALLRRLGIAARYCSGYLFATDGDTDESIEVETHAWLEVLLPDGSDEGTWVGVDPTNRGVTGERHVKIGHGRWYSDVPPIKGIYRGPGGGTLTARVTMTLLG